MMKTRRNGSLENNPLNISSTARVCNNAGKLVKRIQTEVLRSLIRYVEYDDQHETSDEQSFIFLMREKLGDIAALKLLLSNYEALLKKELVKLNTISENSNGLDFPRQLRLLDTMDGVIETSDLLRSYI